MADRSFIIFVTVTVAGVVGFLLAEARGSTLGKWMTKPLASAGFVGAAWAAGAEHKPFGHWILGALAFSWLGDVLLIPRSTFVFGLGAFLVGHLLLAAAFLVRGVSANATAIAAIVAALVTLPVSRWLLPHVKQKMRVPVIAYMTAISAMVSLAVGSHAASPAPIALVAAISFYLSDLSVARDRFVAPGFVNRLWGIPLYYFAQLLFAYALIS
jgi:uncharacterized membrane protein YhhN